MYSSSVKTFPMLVYFTLLLLSINCLAHPATSNDKKDVFNRQIYKACPEANRNVVIRAWKDTQRYADAMLSWVPHGDYQAAMEMDMGDWRKYEDFSGYNFKKEIQGKWCQV